MVSCWLAPTRIETKIPPPLWWRSKRINCHSHINLAIQILLHSIIWKPLLLGWATPAAHRENLDATGKHFSFFFFTIMPLWMLIRCLQILLTFSDLCAESYLSSLEHTYKADTQFVLENCALYSIHAYHICFVKGSLLCNCSFTSPTEC